MRAFASISFASLPRPDTTFEVRTLSLRALEDFTQRLTYLAFLIRSEQADDAVVLCWALNGTREALRLTVAYSGMLLHIIVTCGSSSDPSSARAPSLGQRLLQTFDRTWQRCDRPNVQGTNVIVEASWIPREDVVCNVKQPAAESEFWDLVSSALPSLAQQYQARFEGTPTSGAQVWAEVIQDEQSSTLRLQLIADIYRGPAFAHLSTLGAGDYAHVPRIELSKIAQYIGNPSRRADPVWRDYVLLVEVDRGESSLPEPLRGKQFVLKTDPISISPRSTWIANDDKIKIISRTLVHKAELDILVSTPSHPNVQPAPKAIVTVTLGTTTKLVGWLSEPCDDAFLEDIPSAPVTKKAVARRIQHAQQVCLGVRHLLKHGIVRPDLALDNLVLDPKRDQLMIIDFAPKGLQNVKGPLPPEGSGLLDVVVDGRLDAVLWYAPRGGAADALAHRRTLLVNWHDGGVPKEAMERLLVFNIGCILAKILRCRAVLPWSDQEDLGERYLFARAPTNTNPPSDQDKWEAMLPEPVRRMTQQCFSYDPRERPNLDELIVVLQKELMSK